MMKNALVKITKKDTLIIVTHKHMIFVPAKTANLIFAKKMNMNVFVKNTKNNIVENKFTMQN